MSLSFQISPVLTDERLPVGIFSMPQPHEEQTAKLRCADVLKIKQSIKTEPSEIKLPIEIWEHIISHVDSTDYHNLLFTSKTLHSILQPIYYKSLFYTSDIPANYPISGNTDIYCPFEEMKVDDFLHRSSAPGTVTHKTRICHFDKFIQSLKGNADTRGLIQEICLEIYECDIIPPEEINGSLPNRLSLSMAVLHSVIGAGSIVNVTSLSYKPPFIQERPPNMHAMRMIFAIPTLKNLCMYAIRSWNGRLVEEDNAAMRDSSNVESLTLLSTVPLDNMLGEILLWPKKLLHYRHSLQIDDDDTVWNRTYGPIVSAERMIKSLVRHATTLQTLDYNHAWWARFDQNDGTTFGTLLREFTALESLSTHYECLSGKSFAIFPQSMRVLWIEMESLWDLDLDRVYSDAKHIRDLLEKMVEDMPRLECVVLSSWEDQFDYDTKRIFENL